MNEPPAVVVDAGEFQARCRIGGALGNQEQHRSRACCVHRQLIKQQPGLVVTRLNPRREFTALHRPLANRGARQHPHRGAGLRRHDHFEAGILDEELGKPVGVPAVIRVRIPGDHILNEQPIFKAYGRGPFVDGIKPTAADMLTRAALSGWSGR